MDAMDELCHIVGVRESGDRTPGRLVPFWQPPAIDAPRNENIPTINENAMTMYRRGPEDQAADPAVNVEIAELPRLALRSASDEFSSRFTSSVIDSEAELMRLASPREYQLEEIAVWVDPYQEGLPMDSCTPAFANCFGGPSLKVGTKLTSWLSRKRRTAFEHWLQTEVNELLTKNDVGTQSSSCGSRRR